MITLLAAALLMPEPFTVNLAGKWADQTVTAKVTQTPSPTDGVVISIAMSIRSVNGSVNVTQETAYNIYCVPTRQLVVTVTGFEVKRSVATFGSHQVEWSRNNGPVQQVAIPVGTPIAAPHIFWFTRLKPTVGKTHTYARFNSDTGAWVIETVTYRGPERIPSLGQMVNAHRIEEGDSITWVDDQGKVLRLRRGELLLERVEG